LAQEALTRPVGKAGRRADVDWKLRELVLLVTYRLTGGPEEVDNFEAAA